jgi:hypothetical protein
VGPVGEEQKEDEAMVAWKRAVALGVGGEGAGESGYCTGYYALTESPINGLKWPFLGAYFGL